MNRTIATIAVILCILAQAPVSAQQSRGASSGRASQATRPVRKQAPRPQQRPTRPQVAAASHEQIVEGDVFFEDQPPMISGGCDSCGGGGCADCSVGGGASFCNSCAAPNQFCICFPSHGWVNAEYLLWYQDGMRLPELVTTSPAGTARAQAGVLPAASVLYGGDTVMKDDRSGFRIRFGWWLASLPRWGLEGEYVGLGEQTESFFAQSSGSPILARPFFNGRDGQEDSELVAFPGVINGSIAVDTTNQLSGAAARLRRQLCSSSGCGCSLLCGGTVPTSSRLDSTIGYRFWELKESLQVREDLKALTTPFDGYTITDRFETRNQFNGADLGLVWQGRRGWWSLDTLMRVAVGNVHQTVTIGGTTLINESGATSSYQGGLLAQRTNSGTFDRNQFTMIPELGATLGYQVTRRLRMTAGYSLIYWGNVVRPGDQVDLTVNPDLLPPENVPFSGPNRPQFDFDETDYWVQGLNFGGEFRW